MRTSNLLLATTKETPADASIVSHQLMLRAGLIRKLAAGLYSWLPLGLRVLRKVEHIVRDEMNKSGAQEVLMPMVQPATLWQESERWNKYGAELLRIEDRHHNHFCLGPTHEEVITDLIRNEIRSYKQLPATFYQIQTKFRDEIRPRFGIMRAREFVMKDAYSFHSDAASLSETYTLMHQTYHAIFTRIGLTFRAVEADSGSIGGKRSHEFHVLAESGEDAIAFSKQSDYAANVELASTLLDDTVNTSGKAVLQKIPTPDQRSIDEVSQFLHIPPQQCIKTLLVKGATEVTPVIALLLRGDHELNTIKAEKLDLIASPLRWVDEQDIQEIIHCNAGFIGPIGLSIPIIADYATLQCSDFVCGANEDNMHYQGVNWERDLPIPTIADLRNVQANDPSPDGKGVLEIKRGIEVGHIFQLGDTYSKAMQASILNEQGKTTIMTMGCYGIGISRVVAASIEQNYDEKGIIWPLAIAPFQIVLIPMNMHKSQRLRTAIEDLYKAFIDAGMEILLDDRKERAGVMFSDADLIGIPHRLVLGERGLDKGMIEHKTRTTDTTEEIPLAQIVTILKEKLA